MAASQMRMGSSTWPAFEQNARLQETGGSATELLGNDRRGACWRLRQRGGTGGVNVLLRHEGERLTKLPLLAAPTGRNLASIRWTPSEANPSHCRTRYVESRNRW